MLTTDPNHPELGHGADTERVPQNKVYLVLSGDELAKGFVRPFRDVYRHVGDLPKHPLRDLDEQQQVLTEGLGYVKYEEYPDSERPSIGRYWTQADLDKKACNTTTTMGRELSATYARNPHFYGSTYCVHCSKHLPVREFVWLDGDRVGS